MPLLTQLAATGLGRPLLFRSRLAGLPSLVRRLRSVVHESLSERN